MFVICCKSKMGWSNSAHVNTHEIVLNYDYMTKGLDFSVGCKSLLTLQSQGAEAPALWSQ